MELRNYMNSARKPLYLYSFIVLLLAAGCVFQKGDLPAFLQNSDPSMKPTKISAKTTPAATATPFDINLVLPTARPGETRQWAAKASASSEFLDERWSAMQATGKPDVLACADSVNAWAAANQNTIEWIDLEYEQAVIPTEINIYQNYNPSQVTEVAVFTDDGEKYVVWEGYPEKVKDCPDRMSVTVDSNFHKPVRLVRVTLDQRVNGWGWNEIDAVELTGTRP
jgi:hypothetical protein